MGGNKWKRIARWRMGNEIKEERYWEEPRKRICRLCGREEESWEYTYGRDVGNGKSGEGIGKRR